MKIEFISKNSARRQVAETLKEFVKNNIERIDALIAREAKGMAKLEKAESQEASNQRKDIAYSDRQNKTGKPPLFPGLGQRSDNKLRGEQDPDSFAPGASQTHGRGAYKSEIPMGAAGAMPPVGAPPPPANICMGCGGEDTEPLGNHMGLDHFMCRDCGEVGVTIKEENLQADQNQAQAAMEAMAQQSLAPMVKKDPSDISEDDRENTPKDETENAYKQVWLNQKKKKQEMNKTAIPMGKSVASIRQSAGIGAGSKLPSMKAPSIPNTSATAPQKDAFNTGGMNPTTAAAMGKSESSDAAISRRDISSSSQVVNSSKQPLFATKEKISEGGAKADSSLRGEKYPDSFEPGASQKYRQYAYKSEMNPSKKPFNTGAGHGGIPSKEVPNQDVALESAREGTVPPPEDGGKVVPAPGSGGQIKKTNLKKDEMAPSALCKVADIRNRAAAKYAAKRSQQAADVKAISAVQSAVQKADGIPAPPKAPGASAPKAPPVKAPSNQSPQASSPQPPKL